MVTSPATSYPVFLRFPRGSDEAEYVALREASKEHLEPWEPLPPAGLDPAPSAAFERILDSCNTDRARRFLICLNDGGGTGGTIVGQCSLGEIIRGPLQQAFMGYWIGRAFAGKGYMTAALRLNLAYAFDGLGLHRVEANIQPQNGPSLAVARKIGMRREGYSPRYLQIAGRWADHERWAMTVEDYRELRAAGPGEWPAAPNVR